MNNTSDFDNQDLLFGKNAVLAFLERAAAEAPGPHDPGRKDVLKALARLRAESGAADPALEDELDRVQSIKINKILLAAASQPDRRLDRIKQLAHSQKIPIATCDRKKLDQLAGPKRRHQGVIALVSAGQMWHLDAFLARLELDRKERELQSQSMDGYVVALLDGIEDPHNLGAIIRVAESAGVKALLIPQRRSAGLTGTVAKISAGALANLPVVRVSNLVQALETLKKYGFWIVGLDASASQIYTQTDLLRPLVVVIGGEGKGIGRLVREHCDFLVRIPMLGKTESLNASVAAGILFYEVVRQCLPATTKANK